VIIGRVVVRARAQRDQARGAERERDGVERDRLARPRQRQDQARHRGAGHARHAAREAEQRVGLLQALGRDRLRDQPGQRRHEDRRRGPIDGGQDHEHPDLGAAAEQQGGGDALGDRARDVRGDHHLPPADPVGHHPAGDREQREGDPAGGEDDAQVGDVADRQDGERDRDRGDPVADDRQGLPGEQQPEGLGA
jgi:hypothetical protein